MESKCNLFGRIVGVVAAAGRKQEISSAGTSGGRH
jgi:hypothetical protein